MFWINGNSLSAIEKKINRLEEEIWVLKNPPKYKLLDYLNYSLCVVPHGATVTNIKVGCEYWGDSREVNARFWYYDIILETPENKLTKVENVKESELSKIHGE